MSKTRSFSIFAALAVGVLASDVLAQAGTVVYWRNTTPEPNACNHYKYVIRGTGISQQFHTFPTRTGSPSTIATYPGGRAFFADAELDPLGNPLPGTNGGDHVVLLMTEQATNYAPVVTFFGGGNNEWMDRPSPLMSNDGADSFLSFQSLRIAFPPPTFQPVHTARVLYRFNGPMSTLYTPTFDASSFSFNPFSSFDANPGPNQRITRVTSYSIDTFPTGWDSAGNRVILQRPSGTGFITSIFTVPGATTTVLNNPAITGYSFSGPVFSRTANRIYALATSNNGRTKGLASINPVNGTFTWVLQEGGVGDARIFNFRGPKISPDGLTLAFTLNQTVKKKISASLATIPIAGGRPTTLWTAGPSTVNNFEPTGWERP